MDSSAHDVVSTKSKLDFSQKDYKRYSSMYKEGISSKQEYDQSKTGLTVAKASGNELLKVKNINPYCSLTTNYVQPRFLNSSLAKTADMASSGGSMLETINPGTISARASVNMTYYLK